MSEWDHIRGKTKLPKNSLYEYRERVFSSPVRSLNRIFSTCMPEISLYYQCKDSRGDRNQSVRVLTLKEIAQKGVCDKEYP